MTQGNPDRRVRYEDMVEDQEASIRAVLDVIGEEFDPSRVAFHENPREARTASYAQGHREAL